MPAKIFIIPKSVIKKINRLPLLIHKKISSALNILKDNPVSGVKLEGELGRLYKFRVGDYRIVYKFDPKTSLVEIVKIEHRQGVYK